MKSLIIKFLGFVSVFAVLVAYAILATSDIRKTRRRGYTPPFIGLVAASDLALCLYVAVELFENYEFFIASMLIASLGPPLLMTAIAAVLPKRRRRTSG